MDKSHQELEAFKLAKTVGILGRLKNIYILKIYTLFNFIQILTMTFIVGQGLSPSIHLQNKALCMITYSHYNLTQNLCLKIDDVYEFKVLNFFYKLKK